jgi:hypothetical protein
MNCIIVLEANSLSNALLTAEVHCFYNSDIHFYRATALYVPRGPLRSFEFEASFS